MRISITDNEGTVLESYALEDYVDELRDHGADDATEEELRRWAWDAMTDEIQAAGARLLDKKKGG